MLCTLCTERQTDRDRDRQRQTDRHRQTDRERPWLSMVVDFVWLSMVVNLKVPAAHEDVCFHQPVTSSFRACVSQSGKLTLQCPLFVQFTGRQNEHGQKQDCAAQNHDCNAENHRFAGGGGGGGNLK